MIIELKNKTIELKDELPVVPLRNIVLIPHVITPLIIGRPFSNRALKFAEEETDNYLIFVTQKEAEIENPKEEDFYDVGVIGKVNRVVVMPDEAKKTFVTGIKPVKVKHLEFTGKIWIVKEYEPINIEIDEKDPEVIAYIRKVFDLFKQYIRLSGSLPEDLLFEIMSMDDYEFIIYNIMGYLPFNFKEKQKLISLSNIKEILDILSEKLINELEILKLEKKIEDEVKSKIQNIQKNIFLNEQLKAIKKELGYTSEDEEDGIKEKFLKKLETIKNLKDEYKEKLKEDVERLLRIPQSSPEYTVLYNYLDLVLNLPWDKKTKDTLNIKKAKIILDKDHYGLEKVKERILEHLSLMKLTGRLQGSIICFVGPPGVGKTSLARSIAKAMNRKFVKISLGGLSDEAEIRGHRKTYIGAMPGQIIKKIKEAGVYNPVFLLDEIDKLGRDFRGDPASALLEVLDPEQNSNFVDNYVEIPFNLNDVFFITTANVIHTIPKPLLDRMEIIEISSYTLPEKVQIAKNYLIPKIQKEFNLNRYIKVKIRDDSIEKIIKEYIREAGVRQLERNLRAILRKVARKYVEGEIKNKTLTISPKNLEDYLGVARYNSTDILEKDMVGKVTGLAWTEYGGEILFIESAYYIAEKPNLIVTGRLGEVMKESAMIAYSFAKIKSQELLKNKKKGFFDDKEIHIHIPEGSIPKDGPSAGITIATSLISLCLDKPVRRDVAMTGEITLHGDVLPIGGLKEKVIAAIAAGIKKVIIPKKNHKDFIELPDYIKNNIEIIEVETMEEVLKNSIIGYK